MMLGSIMFTAVQTFLDPPLLNCRKNVRSICTLTVQDFLIKLGIKKCILYVSLGNIKHFSLYHVILRPTKIMDRAEKNWAHFKKKKVL